MRSRNINFITESYLLLTPVGRNCQADRVIQYYCHLGLGLWHPSHRESQLHMLLRA